MPYTRLRLTERGVLLCAYHQRRLQIDAHEHARAPWSRFGEDRPPGTWAVWTGPWGLRAEPRPPSRMVDGMATRLMISPIATTHGTRPKLGTPNDYDAVRAEGVATLLTSADGTELYEACSAAIIGWDGTRLVCVPEDRPRVWSTSEAAIREHLVVHEAPIATRSRLPILLVNAVKGSFTVTFSQREPFPAPARRAIEDLFDSLTAPP